MSKLLKINVFFLIIALAGNAFAAEGAENDTAPLSLTDVFGILLDGAVDQEQMDIIQQATNRWGNNEKFQAKLKAKHVDVNMLRLWAQTKKEVQAQMAECQLQIGNLEDQLKDLSQAERKNSLELAKAGLFLNLSIPFLSSSAGRSAFRKGAYIVPVLGGMGSMGSGTMCMVTKCSTSMATCVLSAVSPNMCWIKTLGSAAIALVPSTVCWVGAYKAKAFEAADKRHKEIESSQRECNDQLASNREGLEQRQALIEQKNAELVVAMAQNFRGILTEQVEILEEALQVPEALQRNIEKTAVCALSSITECMHGMANAFCIQDRQELMSAEPTELVLESKKEGVQNGLRKRIPHTNNEDF